MKKLLMCFLVLATATGCRVGIAAAALPTPAPTTFAATSRPTTATPAAIVTILGDVYVRDGQDNVKGLLHAGDRVQADCAGDWCTLIDGSFDGLKFWRGCGSDNPNKKSCQPR